MSELGVNARFPVLASPSRLVRKRSASDLPVTVEFLQPVIGADMAAVDRVLRDALDSDVVLIRQVAEYIIGGGGKRLRPALLLLTAGATGYRGTEHHTLAAVIEMIHTATLLHDDVVDESRPAPRPRHGQRGVRQRRVGAGRRLPVLARVPDDGRRCSGCACCEILADTTNAIAEGEVLQLMNAGDADLDEAAYLNVIQRKTAKLFEAAARLGAVLGGADRATEDALARYGMHLGTAFQLIDDVLDYSGNADAIGKNLGDDLAEGKMTLPLIRALATGSRRGSGGDPPCGQRRRPDRFRAGHGGARPHRRARLRARARRRRSAPRRGCLHGLPDSPYRKSLLELTSFAAQRTY